MYKFSFLKNKDIHKYGTRNKDKMFVTSVNSKLKYMSTNFVGVKIGNELDSEIPGAPNEIIFPYKLKTSVLKFLASGNLKSFKCCYKLIIYVF